MVVYHERLKQNRTAWWLRDERTDPCTLSCRLTAYTKHHGGVQDFVGQRPFRHHWNRSRSSFPIDQDGSRGIRSEARPNFSNIIADDEIQPFTRQLVRRMFSHGLCLGGKSYHQLRGTLLSQ